MRERAWFRWAWMSLVVAASGVLYSYLFIPDSKRPLIGAVFALCVAMPILAFERGGFLRRLHQRIQRLPSFPYFAAQLAIYEIMMTTGFAVAAAGLNWLGLLDGERPMREVIVMPLDVLLYSAAVCGLMIFVIRVRELLGREVFTSMLISRYRRPVQEERVFLFVDLVGSTAFAELHGDLKAQQLLGDVFTRIAEPVWRYKGDVNDYVGDCAIITWPLARGIKNARCIHCAFAIRDAIETHSAHWLKRYGAVPRLRFALHGGPVVTAEIGVDHHKIAFFGDTVNTTARLEGLCKTLGSEMVISGELAAQIDMPEDIYQRPLGRHEVKGRGRSLEVVALSKIPLADTSRNLHEPVKQLS